MSDIDNNNATKDQQNKLWIREQELDFLITKNRKLIHKLEEAEKAYSKMIPKEIAPSLDGIREAMSELQETVRNVYQQGQREDASFTQISRDLNEFERKLHNQQKRDLNQISEKVTATIIAEMNNLRLDTTEASQRMIELQVQTKEMQDLLKETCAQVQTQQQEIKMIHLKVTTVVRRLLQNQGIKSGPSTGTGATVDKSIDTNGSFFFDDADIKKIEQELKSGLNTNQDDLNLVLQMLRENGN